MVPMDQSINDCRFVDCTFKTEYTREYKPTAKSSYANRFEWPVPCSRFILPQELYERGNHLLPKYSKCNSIYRTDYQQWERMNRRPLPSPQIVRSKPDYQIIEIDVKNGGYEKYLDIYATTNQLQHRPFSPHETQHDAITTWNWLKIPQTRGRRIPLNVCIPKRDLDEETKIQHPKRSAFVPNRGLKSEYQEKFVQIGENK